MTRRAPPQPGVDRMVSTSWSGRRWSSPAARQGRALARGLEGHLPLQHHHVSDQNSSSSRCWAYFSLALKHGIYRDRPNGISVPRWSLSKPHLKGSRPWASLSGILLASRGSVWIWRRGSFRFTRSTPMARSLLPASSARAGSSRFSPRCRHAWWRWRRAPRRIIGGGLIELGHEVRLLPPAHVKPYVRRNKSDQVDAAAIYEAKSRPGQGPCRCVRSRTRPR